MAIFPWDYLTGFMSFLSKHPQHIQVITYDDLPWGNARNETTMYAEEWHNWQAWLQKGDRKKKIYVLLQHDVDGMPEKSLALAQYQHQLGLRANYMMFYRKVRSGAIKRSRELHYDDEKYHVDTDAWAQLEQAGFVLGYHSNAYEQALFDENKATRIFEADVLALRQHFQTRYFSPHGGAKDDEGLSNLKIGIPPSLRDSMRWVNNRHSVKFDGRLSDGRIPKQDPNALHQVCLHHFAQTWKPGGRYLVLTHPHVYDNAGFNPNRSVALLETEEWFQTLWQQYQQPTVPKAVHPLRKPFSFGKMHKQLDDPIWDTLRFSRLRRRFTGC